MDTLEPAGKAEPELHRLIEACSAELQAADKQHKSTNDLYPLLRDITAKNTFESTPDYLIDPKVWETIPDGTRSKYLGRTMLQFDDLANVLQKRHYRQLKSACVGALVFLCGFEVFAHLLEEPLVLMFALACLAIAFMIVFAMRSRTVQMAFLSCRTIAEILRIQFFMDASGAPIQVHDRVLRRYKPVLGRAIAVLKQVTLESKDLESFELPEEVVRKQWFEEQLAYFNKTEGRAHDSARLWGAISSITFGLTIIAMICLVIVAQSHALHTPLGKWLMVGGPSLLGVAAISQFYLESRGFKANAERYKCSVHIFDVKDKDWHSTVHDVGLEALHEIVDWYVASVEREICVPRG